MKKSMTMMLAALLALMICLPCVALAETIDDVIKLPEGVSWGSTHDDVVNAVGNRIEQDNESVTIYSIDADYPGAAGNAVGLIAYTDGEVLTMAHGYYGAGADYYADTCTRVAAICGEENRAADTITRMIATSFSDKTTEAVGYRTPEGSLVMCFFVPDWDDCTTVMLYAPEASSELLALG